MVAGKMAPWVKGPDALSLTWRGEPTLETCPLISSMCHGIRVCACVCVHIHTHK